MRPSAISTRSFILQLQKEKLCILIGVPFNNSHLEFAEHLTSKGRFLSGTLLKADMIVSKDISTALHLFISFLC